MKNVMEKEYKAVKNIYNEVTNPQSEKLGILINENKETPKYGKKQSLRKSETVFQSFGTPLALKRKSSLGADQMQRSNLGKRELMGGHYLANADFRINQPKIKSDEHETDKLSHTSSHDSESTHKPASADVNKEGQIRIISSYCDNCFDRISDFQDELGRRMTCDINWEFIDFSDVSIFHQNHTLTYKVSHKYIEQQLYERLEHIALMNEPNEQIGMEAYSYMLNSVSQ